MLAASSPLIAQAAAPAPTAADTAKTVAALKALYDFVTTPGPNGTPNTLSMQMAIVNPSLPDVTYTTASLTGKHPTPVPLGHFLLVGGNNTNTFFSDRTWGPSVGAPGPNPFNPTQVDLPTITLDATAGSLTLTDGNSATQAPLFYANPVFYGFPSAGGICVIYPQQSSAAAAVAPSRSPAEAAKTVAALKALLPNAPAGKVIGVIRLMKLQMAIVNPAPPDVTFTSGTLSSHTVISGPNVELAVSGSATEYFSDRTWVPTIFRGFTPPHYPFDPSRTDQVSVNFNLTTGALILTDPAATGSPQTIELFFANGVYYGFLPASTGGMYVVNLQPIIVLHK
jgi:hypothetical protein